MDRLITKQTPEGTLTYGYDAAGHLASMSSSNPNGVNVSYDYDTLNRLWHVVDSRLGTTTYSYDTANNVATVKYPNNVETDFVYDELNRTTQLATSQTGYLYTLDNAGNRKKVTELNNRTVNWTYDGIYRLTNETISLDPNNKNGSVGYGLDPVGNRQSETSSLSGVNSGSYTFNQDDELAGEGYDSNGNVTAGGGNTFVYDTENHLVSMGGTVALQYDGDGNRVKKVTAGATTTYLVDDLNPTGYPQVVEELTNGVVTRTYTYGLQRISQEQVISNTWTPSFYGYDGFGTVRQLTSSTGVITDTYDYDAFGNKINSTGSTPNNYLYRGEQLDSDLGLYYLRARYYNPLSGRFVSRDPQDGTPRDPGSQHKYNYAETDPVNMVDPSGNAAIVEFLLLQFRGYTPIPFPHFCDQIEPILGPVAGLLPFCKNPCPDCSVEVKCRGIEYGNLGALGIQHCDARVTDGQGQEHSLTAGPDPPDKPTGPNTILNAWDTGPSGAFTGNTVFKDKNNCPLADCLVGATDRYQNSPRSSKPHYDYYNGPNSNTWLKGTFGSCGINLPIHTWGSVW
jgi:RHS repeat-associated protein